MHFNDEVTWGIEGEMETTGGTDENTAYDLQRTVVHEAGESGFIS